MLCTHTPKQFMLIVIINGTLSRCSNICCLWMSLNRKINVSYQPTSIQTHIAITHYIELSGDGNSQIRKPEASSNVYFSDAGINWK